MPDFEERPLEEDVEHEQTVAAPTALELETIEQDLYGASQAAGVQETEHAIAQVASGAARPQELLEWIDDLRNPEEKVQDEEDPGTGFLPDFAADTEMAAADAEKPLPAGGDLPTPDGKRATVFSADDDLDYVFPATRRRRHPGEVGDDDDEGDPLAPAETKQRE